MAKEEFYMNKFFEKSILDELYEAKCEDFADSIQEEMKEELNSLDKVENGKKTDEVITFIDSYASDFLNYLEKNKRTSLIENNEYKEILNQIEKIKLDNPNVRAFLEDNGIVSLSTKEQKEVFNVFELNDELQIIELKFAFKLGIKEIIIFLKQMHMI